MGADVTLYPLTAAGWLADAALPMERDRDFFADLRDLEIATGFEWTCVTPNGETVTLQCVTVGDLLALPWQRTQTRSAAALAYLSCMPTNGRVGIRWQ